MKLREIAAIVKEQRNASPLSGTDDLILLLLFEILTRIEEIDTVAQPYA